VRGAPAAARATGAEREQGGRVRALSLTQPWAWLVLHAGKNIENRVWTTKFRGKFLIHAAKAMTRKQYEDAVAFTLSVDRAVYRRLPRFDQLDRGGIVGSAHLDYVLDRTTEPTVPWHMAGQYGFMLGGITPLPFLPCKGALGFWGNFDVRDGQAVAL
jgi:hypothetical protein